MPEVVLTEEQKQAVTGSGSILVGAAAGSGKTFVITERIARILSDRKMPVKASRLLMLTFSNAAASEMRQKIKKKLADMIAEDPSDEYLRDQQRLLRRAHIGTVHSFCQKILREFFSEAGISPDFSLCDDNYSSTLREEALDEAFDRLCGEQPEKAALLTGNFGRSRSAREAMEAVLALHSFEENLVNAERWENGVLEKLKDDTPFTSSDAAAIEAGRLAESFRQVLTLLERAVRMMEDENASGKGYEYLCSVRDCCSEMAEALSADQWDTAVSIAAAGTPGSLTFQKSISDETKAAAKAAREIFKRILTGFGKVVTEDIEHGEKARSAQFGIASALITAERYFRDALNRIKAERMLLEYDDLESLVISLFYDEEGRITETARAVSDRFDHVLVDEFQDTNERQKLIFDAVSDGGRKLFCVGDVKQSIYSFRRADPSIFTQMRNECGENGRSEYISLHSNFRSSSDVIGAVNAVFDPLMTSRFGGVDYMPGERLVYGGASGRIPGSGMEYHAVNCLTEDLPEAVAGYVRRLISEENYIETPEGKRRIREEDICILLRTVRGRAELYTQALKDKGIRCSSEVTEDFFEASEIMVMMSLLRAVDNPGSDIDLAAVMLSPICGFTVDEFISVKLGSEDGKLWTAIRNSEDAKCLKLKELVSGLREKASVMSVREIVREAVEQSEAETFLTALPDTARRKSRLRALIDFAGSFTSFGGSGLSDFLRQCDGSSRAGRSPESSQRASGGVLVTSVHRSKGLEWPVVILADAGRELNTSADSGANVLFDQEIGIAAKVRMESEDGMWMAKPPEYGIISGMKRESGKAEELRILYVALTRAKNRIAVFAARKAGSSGKIPDADLIDEAAACCREGQMIPVLVSEKNRFADWIDRALGASGFSSSDLEREETVRGDISLICRTPEGYAADPVNGLGEGYGADSALVEEIDRRLSFVYSRGGTVQIPTSLTVTQLTESFRPARSYRPAFVKQGGLTASERGTALHEFLQHCDIRRASEDPAGEIARLREMQFLGENEAASISEAKVMSFFKGRIGQMMLKADRLYREYPFMGSIRASDVIPDVDPEHGDDVIVIQGAADCVIEKDGRLTILDYKTDNVNDPEELKNRYSKQLRQYCTSIGERLGMPVVEAVIWSFRLEREVIIDI
ncbi:MAG: UvrD-helicase domain-containing protein [Oscillospiraceae bacterium]|nr:UvrD-helicase domain-containing protein [Oscillospiraceae bacterium]